MQDRATARIAHLGKVLAPLDGSVPFATGYTTGVTSARLPNYSDHFLVRVHAGVTPSDELLAAVADLMNDVLPAWEDWETYSGWLYADGGPDGTSNPDTSALAE